MTENISINIEPDELKKILLDYYKKLYNEDDIKITFYPKKQGYYEDDELVTTIKLERKIKIGSNIATITNELDKEDLKEVIDDNIKESDYIVSYLNLKTELKTYENHGMFEGESYSSPKFIELQAILKRKEKVKQKIKEK